MKRICVVIGTRPEAIKLAPLINALRAPSLARAGVETSVCVTAQHREMLDQVLRLFGVVPDCDLGIMRDGQDLTDVTSRVLIGMRDALRTLTPQLVVVQGDTTTSFAASLAAFYERIPVAHVEAGLRTGNIYSPWPEEINRRLTSAIACLHFAPTERARQNLLREGIDPSSVHVTGNTVVDALLQVSARISSDAELHGNLRAQFSYLDASKRLILVTGHRRESFGKRFEAICRALKRLSERGDVEIVYPVHMNPNVRAPVHRILDGVDSVHLIDPLDYLPFVYLMGRAFLVLTDSGGVQEEAPSLGKPVLVMRDTTERQEGVDAGTAKLVGVEEDAILEEANALLDDRSRYQLMASANNPYGDGAAAKRIAEAIVYSP